MNKLENMDKEEKIKYLENLKGKISNLIPSQSNIDKLDSLVNEELRRELTSVNQNKVYIFNLNQTIKKELKTLINSRKNPRNRIDELKDATSNFKQDINRYLGDLRQGQ